MKYRKLIFIMAFFLTSNVYAGNSTKELRNYGESTGQLLFISKIMCKKYKTPSINKIVKIMKKKYGGYSSFNTELKANYNHMKNTMTKALAKEKPHKIKATCIEIENNNKATLKMIQ